MRIAGGRGHSRMLLPIFFFAGISGFYDASLFSFISKPKQASAIKFFHDSYHILRTPRDDGRWVEELPAFFFTCARDDIDCCYCILHFFSILGEENTGLIKPLLQSASLFAYWRFAGVAYCCCCSPRRFFAIFPLPLDAMLAAAAAARDVANTAKNSQR